MGRVKEAWTQSLERGWDAPDTNVCADCVEDDFLKEIIEDNLTATQCDYCGRTTTNPIAAPVEDIMPTISSTLFRYYNDPDSAGVPYDKGYVIEPDISTSEALYDIGLECDADLFSDIENAFHNDFWVEAADGHWAGTQLGESLKYDWNHFVHTVKHQCRYFFSSIQPQDDWSEERSPLMLLKALASMVIDFDLFMQLPQNTHLYRVRMRDDSATWPLTFAELGPPPNEKANAGRMNPAGISYFYLAESQQTALAETIYRPPCRAIVAEFVTTQDLLLLDLCNLPPFPSIFDPNRHEERELLYFLQDFVTEISKPTQKNGKEHIDYVPSQIVSEFFAREFPAEDQQRLNGIRYPSAIHSGGANIVLFPPLAEHGQFKKLISLAGTGEKLIATWADLQKMI